MNTMHYEHTQMEKKNDFTFSSGCAYARSYSVYPRSLMIDSYLKPCLFFFRTYANPKDIKNCRNTGKTHCCGLGILGLQHYSVPHVQCHDLLPFLSWSQWEQGGLFRHGSQSPSTCCGPSASLYKCQPQDDPNQSWRKKGEWGDNYSNWWRWYAHTSLLH